MQFPMWCYPTVLAERVKHFDLVFCVAASSHPPVSAMVREASPGDSDLELLIGIRRSVS